MFNWPTSEFARKIQDSTVIKAAVDVVFCEKYGTDVMRGGNPAYEEMMEKAMSAAAQAMSSKWVSHDEIYQAAKDAIS